MSTAHHAVLYCADSLETSGLPSEFWHTSVDVDVSNTDRLSIGQVRELIEIAHQKPISAPHRTIVVVATSIAPEAQHALLKILEDPPPSSRFVLLLPNTSQLLPTLLSRLQIEQTTSIREHTEEFLTFLSQPVGKRMETIAENAKAKNTAWMSTMLAQASRYTNNLPVTTKKILLTTSEYAEFKGASKKMLLEALALALPVKKS